MYPPVVGLVRIVTKDYAVPEMNVTLRKGTTVIIPSYSIQRDEEFFPNPDEYRPERFLAEEVAKRPAIAFQPFGHGPRNCIGERFGLMQARIGLALLLKNFKFTLHPSTDVPIQFRADRFLLEAKGGVFVSVEKI